MTDDARALLSAIVADPADDTVRLAYADCIEEHGNAARAQFIRLQVEAERLHPDTNARARLESQAETLFVEHWIEWWGEVCAEVGFPIPIRSPRATLLRRLTRWFRETNPENPYRQVGVDVRWPTTRTIDNYGLPFATDVGELSRVMFRRGFPELVGFDQAPPESLSAWPTVSPLVTLLCNRIVAVGWDDGPHLARIRELALTDCEPEVLEAVARSDNLAHLEDLTLYNGEYIAEGVIVEEFANQTADAVRLLRDRRLKRLSLQVWTDAAATAVAEAAHLASLTALDVDILPDVSDDYEGATWRLARLVRSPHLAGLKELTVSGWPARGWPAAPLSRIACTPATLSQLQKLTINADLGAADLDPHPAAMLEGTTFPELEELRVRGIYLNHHSINLLVRSPLLKQLRHFAFGAWGVDAVFDADLRRLPEMFDLDRLETFRFTPDHDVPGLDELKRRLGDRLRMH